MWLVWETAIQHLSSTEAERDHRCLEQVDRVVPIGQQLFDLQASLSSLPWQAHGPSAQSCIVMYCTLTLQTSRAFRESHVFPLPSGEEENTVTVVSDLDQPAFSSLSCVNEGSCILLQACHSVLTIPLVALADRDLEKSSII